MTRTPPAIKLKRVYEPAVEGDGRRILVDRLWPRGLSREAVGIDAWVKDLAPSNELRQWYQHDPDKWVEFCRRYALELDRQPEAVAALKEQLSQGMATFVYSSKEERLNNAAALKAYLEGVECQ